MIDLAFLVNLAVAVSAIATLLLNAYVAWGNGRDKTVELLGSIRGLAGELAMRYRILSDELSPNGDQLRDFQKVSQDIANRLAERIGAATGKLSEPAAKIAMRLTENLYGLRKLEISEIPTDEERQTYNRQLKEVLNAAGEFADFMGEDIERYWKLRNVIAQRVKNLA